MMLSEYNPSGRSDSPVDSDRCKASVLDHSWRRQCSRKVWRDGWCKQHHPDTIAERRRIRDLREKRQIDNDPRFLLADALEEIARLKARVAELEANHDKEA